MPLLAVNINYYAKIYVKGADRACQMSRNYDIVVLSIYSLALRLQVFRRLKEMAIDFYYMT